MEHVSIKQLSKSRHFLENIRWDVTPKIFFEPRFTKTANEQGKRRDKIEDWLKKELGLS